MPIQIHICPKSQGKPHFIPIIDYYPAKYRGGEKVFYANLRIIWLHRTIHIIFGKRIKK